MFIGCFSKAQNLEGGKMIENTPELRLNSGSNVAREHGQRESAY
jgi:hypothetical protein